MAKVETRLKRIPMTREEFEKLPEGPPYYDYIGGEAIEVNRPTGRHQIIVVYLTYTLTQHIWDKDLGLAYPDVDVFLPTGVWVGPDISYLTKEHSDRYDKEKGDIIGNPDLIVEVSSQSTADYDRVEKMDEYQRAGVPWVWLVDQDTLTVEEFRWTQEGYLRVAAVKGGGVFRPKLFPDLEINLKALLRE